MYSLKAGLLVVTLSFGATLLCCQKNEYQSSNGVAGPYSQPFNTAVSPTPTVSTVTDEDSKVVEALISSRREPSDSQRNNASNELTRRARSDKQLENYIAARLVNEVSAVCEQGDSLSSQADVRTLSGASEILGNLRHIEALDILIECSNRQLPVGGLSYYNYPTIPGILKYGTAALPALERKLKDSTPEIKCQIASILALIGGRKSKEILIAADKAEVDEEVRKCLEANIAAINQHR